MRRITLWVLSTISALVLLFSYRTSTMGEGGAFTGGLASGTSNGSTGGSGSAGNSGGSASSGGSAAGGNTYDGASVDTRWGPVQVRIVVAGGRITDVIMLQVPDGNPRDQEINSYAVPILRDETLQAQSAQVDAVSGATITSDGYQQSLQSAIDAAHLR